MWYQTEAAMETRQRAATEAKSGSSPRIDHEDFPYEGEAGRTQRSPVHVPIPGGLVRSIEVHRTINVATDPQLKDAALTGALHRFESGEELAIPFVYHDPAARKLVLVVPEALRHEALRERARLLERLAADTRHPIPRYAAEAKIVIGRHELAAFLEQKHVADGAPGTEPADAGARERDEESSQRSSELAARADELDKRAKELDERTQELDKRTQELDRRQQRLAQRGEEVTSREDELRTLAEELEVRQREIAFREQELEGRVEALRVREQEVARSVAAARPAAKSVPPPAAAPIAQDVVEDDVEELDDIDAVGTSPGLVADDAVEIVEDGTPITKAPVLVDDEDVVEEVDDLVEVVTGVGPIEQISKSVRASGVVVVTSKTGAKPARETEPELDASSLPSPGMAPPPGFLADESIQMAAAVNGDQVMLFARVGEGHEAAFAGSVDLLAQLVLVDQRPVVLLTLVGAGDQRPYVRRAALDPFRADHKAVLERLRSKFAATVAQFRQDGRFDRSFEVAAERESNVQMVLERARRQPQTGDASIAIERALAVPPPVRDNNHPFRSERGAARDAAQAFERVHRIGDWSVADKRDHALLVLSIPRGVVDAAVQEATDDALKFGIALPADLAKRAIAGGMASDTAELTSKLVAAFSKTAVSPDRGGLSPERVAANWEALLSAASENEVAIDSATHELAWTHIRAVRPRSEGAAALADVEVESLPQMGVPELAMLLEHPKVRVEAALELCSRGDPDILPVLYRAVRKMPRTEVVRVVPRVLTFGEAAGDALIDGLTARKTFVRHASALALGHLKLRRALVPLVHLLQNEPSDVWQDVARVLGEFGVAGLRTLTRALKDPKGQEERFSYALACFADAGCVRQVAELESDHDPDVAHIALEARGMRDRVLRHARAIRGQADPEPNDVVRPFARRFYEELEGRSTGGDLPGSAD